MNTEIKKLQVNDLSQFKELITLFERVFEMENFRMPDDAHLQSLLNKDDFIVFIALSEGKLVGGLTAYVLRQYYIVSPLVYIYDLAVHTSFQRKGIGSRLLKGISDYSRERGMEEVFVQADEEDDHALEFYRSTGGRAEQVVHFTYPLKTT